MLWITDREAVKRRLLTAVRIYIREERASEQVLWVQADMTEVPAGEEVRIP
jgi:hypothetical protein